MRPISERRVEQWAERYRDIMLRVALGLMARPDDAEDVVQRALLAAVARARRRPQAQRGGKRHMRRTICGVMPEGARAILPWLLPCCFGGFLAGCDSPDVDGATEIDAELGDN